VQKLNPKTCSVHVWGYWLALKLCI
jgi:hypothetical protein